MTDRGPAPLRRRERTVSSAVAVYIVVLLTLQIFLLTVALDALQRVDATMAWVSAVISVVLAVGSALFSASLRR